MHTLQNNFDLLGGLFLQNLLCLCSKKVLRKFFLQRAYQKGEEEKSLFIKDFLSDAEVDVGISYTSVYFFLQISGTFKNNETAAS